MIYQEWKDNFDAFDFGWMLIRDGKNSVLIQIEPDPSAG